MIRWRLLRPPVHVTSSIAASLVAIAIPAIHIGVVYRLWGISKPEVDRDKCSCTCFDTINRGRYEWPPSSYKHVYYNSTPQSWMIWTCLVTTLVLFYEAFSSIWHLLLEEKLRFDIAIVLLSSVYPHYYGAWNFFNYWNEEFFIQFNHQLFFSVTEIVSSIVLLRLCDKNCELSIRKLVIILVINASHIGIASIDQFVKNVLLGGAMAFEAVRDIGLMIPDLLHVLYTIFEIKKQLNATGNSRHSINKLHKEEIYFAISAFILLILLGINL